MRLLILLCLSSSALAQGLPPLDPINELTACRGQVEWITTSARVGAGYAEQFRLETEQLKKKILELEAKLKEKP